MTEYGDQLLRRPARENWFGRFQVVALVALTLVAIIAQVYIPRLIPNTGFLEIPLLLTIYFSLMRHSQLAGLFFGAFVGLAQDSLSNLPYGMYGIAKTLVGYFAASVSMRFDVDNVFIRFTLTFLLFLFPPVFLLDYAPVIAGAASATRSPENSAAGGFKFCCGCALVSDPGSDEVVRYVSWIGISGFPRDV